MSDSPKKKVVINRAKWRSGETYSSGSGQGITKLLNPEGYMCCLGFACQQLGNISNDALMQKASPLEFFRSAHLDSPIRDLFVESDKTLYYHTRLSSEAININDGTRSRARKEELLITLFAENDIELIFEGEYETP